MVPLVGHYSCYLYVHTCLAIFLCRRCVGVESEPHGSWLCIEKRSDCSHFAYFHRAKAKEAAPSLFFSYYKRTRDAQRSKLTMACKSAIRLHVVPYMMFTRQLHVQAMRFDRIVGKRPNVALFLVVVLTLLGSGELR